jgi:hypothetical protein
VHTLRLLLALLLVPSALACKTECSKQSDCNTDGGEACLWGATAGCGAQGHCQKQDSCAKGGGAPPLLCGCTTHVTVAPECIPSNGLTEPTTSGACSTAGDDAGTGNDAADAGTESDAEDQ